MLSGWAMAAVARVHHHQGRTQHHLGIDLLHLQTTCANPRNKQKFLYFIGSELEKAGVELYHSSADADYDIVSTACTMAKRRSVAVVGDDTDLLVLLLHHLSPRHHVIFLQTASKILNIRILQEHLAPGLTASLLFLHAITGCDTTSRPHSIGKVTQHGNEQMPSAQGPCQCIHEAKSKPR